MAIFGARRTDPEAFTGALMIADWYQRRVGRDNAESKANSKKTGKFGR